MNQTVKIFFTDMDDTLLNSEKQVTKENMDSVIIDLGFHLHDEVYLNVSEESRD